MLHLCSQKDGDDQQLVSTTVDVDGTVPYDLVYDIETIEGCVAGAEICKQKLTYRIPGCDSLEDLHTYNLTNLKYVCFENCDDVEFTEADKLKVEAQVVLQSTQDSCGSGISFDLSPDTVILTLESTLADYIMENNVFVADEDDALAYFVLAAESSVEIASLTINELKRTFDGVTVDSSFTVGDCPDPDDTDVCFSVDISNLDIEVDTVETVHYAAKVIVSFVDGSKRAVGLSGSYNLNKVVRILNKIEKTSEDTSSGYNLAIPAAAIVIAAF
jgi:hypothetical protein